MANSAGELSRRIVVSFSAQDLRAFAAGLGVEDIAWDRGSADAARDLVRAFERRGALSELRAALAGERPLVEWSDDAEPEPIAPAGPIAPGRREFELPTSPGDAEALGMMEADSQEETIESSARTELAALTADRVPASARTAVAARTAGGAPVSARPRIPAGPPAAAGFRAAPPTPGSPGPLGAADPHPFTARVAAGPGPLGAADPGLYTAGSAGGPGTFGAADPGLYTAGSAGGSAGRSLNEPSGPRWPGVVVPPAPRAPRGLDSRLLVAFASIMLVALAVAFAAGRLLIDAPATAEGAPSASASATPAPNTGRRPVGLATRTADAFARALTSVARACELASGGQASVEILRAAHGRCGPRVAPQRRPAGVPPAATTAESAPTPSPQAGRGSGADAPPGSAPREPCIAACDAQHRACTSACGPEPTQSSLYAEHQACLGRCLTAESKCRLTCN